MDNTKILVHDCDHEFQDKRYGRKRRVMNKVEKRENTWRCTVCEREKRTNVPRRRR